MEPAPGDVLTIRTPDLAGWLIRLGAWLRGRPHHDNHVAIVWRIDASGRTWLIEGRPGGCGEIDMALYTGMVGTSNADQPKTAAQRAAVTDAAEKMLRVGYDWAGIGMDVEAALRLEELWRVPDWSADVAPAHVVCSSLAAWVYAHAGLARPAGRLETVIPADWQAWNDGRGWAP